MYTQPIKGAPAAPRRGQGRGWWWLLLALLITLGGLGLLRALPGAADGAGPAPVAVAQPADPALPATLNYIRVHEAVGVGAGAAAVEPAALGVLGYLRAHGATIGPAAPAPVDPAAQSVLDYLRAHGVR